MQIARGKVKSNLGQTGLLAHPATEMGKSKLSNAAERVVAKVLFLMVITAVNLTTSMAINISVNSHSIFLADDERIIGVYYEVAFLTK